MGESAAEIKKHMRSYWVIGGVLYFFTIVTVMARHLHLSVHATIAVALFIASIKATLVALFFMHLISEKKMIYWTLALTATFFLVLIFMPVGQHLDKFF